MNFAGILFIGLQAIILFCALCAVFWPARVFYTALRIGIAFCGTSDNFNVSELVEMQNLYRDDRQGFHQKYRRAILIARVQGIGFILIIPIMTWIIFG